MGIREVHTSHLWRCSHPPANLHGLDKSDVATFLPWWGGWGGMGDPRKARFVICWFSNNCSGSGYVLCATGWMLGAVVRNNESRLVVLVGVWVKYVLLGWVPIGFQVVFRDWVGMGCTCGGFGCGWGGTW